MPSLDPLQGGREQRESLQRRADLSDGNESTTGTDDFCAVFNQPHPFNEEQFGWSVAISQDGCRVAVGTSNDPGVVYLYDDAGTLMRTLHSPATSWLELPSSHYFGYSIALNCDGSRLVVGSHGASRAYLFDTNTGDLLQTFYETDSSTTTDNDSFFGYSVSISCDGTIIAVGDPNGHTWQAKYAGKVYVFSSKVGANGGLLKALYHSPNPTRNGNFGISVALNAEGSRLLVGAWQDGQHDAGAAYLWEVDGEDAALLQTFRSPPHPAGSDYSPQWFGYDVDISCEGDKVLIGSRAGQSKIEEAGAVYLFSTLVNRTFSTNETSQEPLHSIEAPNQVAGNQFGASVSMNCAGDQILVGSYGDGSAYLFHISPEETAEDDTKHEFPTLQQSWQVPVNRNYIGASVGLSGNGMHAVIGAPRAHGDSPYLETAGAAYLACLYDTPLLAPINNSERFMIYKNLSAQSAMMCSIPEIAYDKNAYLDDNNQMLAPALLVVFLATMAYLHCHGAYWNEIIRQRIRRSRSSRETEYERALESEVELTLLDNDDDDSSFVED